MNGRAATNIGAQRWKTLRRLIPQRHPSFGQATLLTAVLVAYFLAAASALYAFGESTPIWYSNAFVIVALLHQPLRRWQVYIVGAAFADAGALALFSEGSTYIVLADVLEIVLVAGAIQLSGGVHHPLFLAPQLVRVVVACALGPAVSGALGGWIISSQFKTDFFEAWRIWYTASALGLLMVAPFILSWLDPQLRARASAQVNWGDALWLAGGTIAVAVLLQTDRHHELLFLVFPILFAITWRFGLAGATLGMLTVTLTSLYATWQQRGPLLSLSAPVSSAAERVEVLQVFIAAVLLSSLPLALLHARQRELKNGLRRSNEARAEFLAAMSHEIRTPMTAVLGVLDLMSVERITPRQQDYVSAMKSSGRHLLSIINDILDFSRIESGKLEVEAVDFSLRELLEAVRSVAHPLAVERGLLLDFEAQEIGADVLVGDPLRLRQVLLNLAGNAIKFTERGRVTVSVAQRTAMEAGWPVTFLVRDTGIGIHPDKLEQLFAPFTQADRSTARQYGGTGLGLAISHRLVEAMGGKLTASSVPGEGSVFRFELCLPQGSAQTLRASEHKEQRRARPQRILVAEDVEINREILRVALQRQGHDIVFANDGAQALTLVQEQEFDLVLMDVQMPVLDGVEATRRIRRLAAPRGSIPIIGLTANVMARERERYLGVGMNSCLGKPIDWDELNAAILGIAGAGETQAAAPLAVAFRPVGGLLDDRIIENLRELAGDEIGLLIGAGISSYVGYLDILEAPDVTADAMFQTAHKVTGSSGTLGFAAINSLAAAIEEAASAGETPAHLVRALRAVFDATREELARRGLAVIVKG